MPNNTDWFPGRRTLQLAMAKDWVLILPAKETLWNIPGTDIDEFIDLTDKAETIFNAVTSKDRTSEMTAQCQAAFKALGEKMRFLKNRHFFVPPLADSDLIALQLTPKDSTHTVIPIPTDQAEAILSNPNLHMILLYLQVRLTNKTPDPHLSDYGYRIYWGVRPLGGATVEAATGKKRELITVPVSGDELPHSLFTRRKKEIITFDAEDSGKTVYFCIRFENAKGEPGPWGPILSAIIT
jgi:hypothetical protein